MMKRLNKRVMVRAGVLIVVLVACLAVFTSGASKVLLNRQKPSEPNPKASPAMANQKDQRRAEFESLFPVADYDEVPPVDSEKRLRRVAKNKHFDNQHFVHPDTMGRVTSTIVALEGGPVIPPLPTVESDAILIGTVSDSQAHLSNDKNGIYSEFTFNVETVLKTGEGSEVADASICIIREGGFVKYPSGNRELYAIQGKQMPRVGAKYVLFLRRIETGQDYLILTGYELKDSKVLPLDRESSKYRGVGESAFLADVRAALATARPQP